MEKLTSLPKQITRLSNGSVLTLTQDKQGCYYQNKRDNSDRVSIAKYWKTKKLYNPSEETIDILFDNKTGTTAPTTNCNLKEVESQIEISFDDSTASITQHPQERGYPSAPNPIKTTNDLTEIASRIEKDFGEIILSELVGAPLKNGKRVRLYDTTKHSAEVYYSGNVPHIYDFSTYCTWFPIPAYQKDYGLERKDTVIELGKRFGLLPPDYGSKKEIPTRIPAKREQPAESEKQNVFELCNPITKHWDKDSLSFWWEVGIIQPLLEKYGISPLVSFDKVMIETGEVKTFTPNNTYAYQTHQTEGVKKYSPFDKKFKWQWIGKGNNKVIWGLEQLPESCEKILIVEGLKDALCIVAHFSDHGIYAVGLDSVSTAISKEIIKSLQSKAKEVLLCLDNDKAGKEANLRFSATHNLPILPYPADLTCKDIAEICANDFKVYSKEKALEWLIDKNQSMPNTFQRSENSQYQSNTNTSFLNIKSVLFCMQESMSKPIPKRLFSEFWYENEVCILFSDTNTGKSVLAVQIAEMIANGKKFDFFECETTPQKVLYLDFELSDRQFTGRYSVKNGQLEIYENPYLFGENFLRASLNQDASFDDFEKNLLKGLSDALQETGARVMIVDNITFLKSEAEKASEALRLMKNVFKRLKDNFELSLLVLAHTPKRDRKSEITINHLSGSSQIANFADSIFTIGVCQYDDKLRYIKQLKVREDAFKYGGNNVIVCELRKKQINFLAFNFLYTETEQNALASSEKKQQEKEKGSLIADIKDLYNLTQCFQTLLHYFFSNKVT
jgi:KaiC/GvpD/RAD55 family RecA-like ATPase